MSIPTRPREDGQSPCAHDSDCNEPATRGSAHCEKHRPRYLVERLPLGGVNYTLIGGSPVRP